VLNLDGATGGDVPVLDVNLDRLAGGAAQALDLGGFKLTGTLSVKLIKAATDLIASVSLPSLFSAVGGGGGGLTAQATATADNQQDIQFDELYFQGPAVALGGFQLKNLAFCYQNHVSDGFCQKRTGVDFGSADPAASSWNATAKVSVLGLTIDAAPPPPTYGLGFVNGGFAFGGAQATFPAPGIQVATGVFLNTIGGSLGVDPVRITGTVGLSVTDIVSINGSVFVVVPANGQSYAFTGTELGNVLRPPLALPKVTVNAFALAVGGSVGLKLPYLGVVPLADGYVMYAYPTYVAVGGGFNLSLFNNALVVDGGLQGQVNFGSGQFNIEGSVGLYFHVWPLNATLQAAGVVSSTGMAVCGQANGAAAGIGYKWGQGLTGVNVMIGSCNMTPYESAVSASSAQAGAGYRIRIPAGLPNEMLRLIGQGGAPDVTVVGPGGAQATSGGQSHAMQGPFVITRDPQLDTTYVAVLHPAAGTYTVTANAGSPAIARVFDAHGFSPTITARVTRHGLRRVLRYAANTEPGERITFIERGPGVDREIGSTVVDHGTITFTPAPGRGSTRQVIAIASENGTPLVLAPGATNPGQRVVCSYRASGPRRLGTVRRLRAAVSGQHVAVSFAGVPGARSYAVLIALQNGVRTDYVVSRRSLRATIATGGTMAGTVTVRALGDGLTSATGTAARATIRPPKTGRRHRRGRHR
jgi:hypothetical protein